MVDPAVTSEAFRLFREPPTSTLRAFACYMLAAAAIWGVGSWLILQDPLRLKVAAFGVACSAISLIFLQLIHGEEAGFEELHRDLTRVGESETEFRIRRKDGGIRWVRQQLQVVEGGHETQIFGAVRDITQRKLTEIALKGERDFSSAVLDNAAVMVTVLDRDNRIVRVNEAAANFSGRLAKELEGESLTFELESPVEIDGKKRSAEWKTSRLEDDGVYYVVATGVDTTDRRAAEEELAKHQGHLEELVRDRSSELAQSERRLVDAERLASVGTLAAGVAHQINNPIDSNMCSTLFTRLGRDGEGPVWG